MQLRTGDQDVAVVAWEDVTKEEELQQHCKQNVTLAFKTVFCSLPSLSVIGSTPFYTPKPEGFGEG